MYRGTVRSRFSAAAVALLFACACLVTACDERANPHPPAASASISPPNDPAPLDAALTSRSHGGVAPRADARPKRTPYLAASADRKTKHRAFLAAIDRGRQATAANQFDAGLAAYDEALSEVIAFSDLVYAERGYTNLRAGRYADAIKDFNMADQDAEDSTLLAQVWWNRGLAEKALGHRDLADVAFFRSRRLRPSKAKDAELAGRKVCPLAIDRTRVPIPSYDSWLALGNAISGALPDAAKSSRFIGLWKDEADAKSALCADCPEDGLFFEKVGAFDRYLLGRHDGKLSNYGGAGLDWKGGNLPEPPDVSTLVTAGKYTVLRVVSPFGLAFMVAGNDAGTFRECLSDALPEGENYTVWAGVPIGCTLRVGTTSATETLKVFDLERHLQVLAIAQKVVVSLDVTGDTPTFDVTVKEGPHGFTTDGCGPIPYEQP